MRAAILATVAVGVAPFVAVFRRKPSTRWILLEAILGSLYLQVVVWGSGFLVLTGLLYLVVILLVISSVLTGVGRWRPRRRLSGRLPVRVIPRFALYLGAAEFTLAVVGAVSQALGAKVLLGFAWIAMLLVVSAMYFLWIEYPSRGRSGRALEGRPIPE